MIVVGIGVVAVGACVVSGWLVAKLLGARKELKAVLRGVEAASQIEGIDSTKLKSSIKEVAGLTGTAAALHGELVALGFAKRKV